MKKLFYKKSILIIGIIIVLVIMAILSPLLSINYRTVKLIDSIEKEDISKMRIILEDGVDPNSTDLDIRWWLPLFETSAHRPLSIACNIGNLDIVKLLIEHGATAEAIEGTGWSPLRETLFYYHPDDVEIVKLLLMNGADPDFTEDELPVFSAANMIPKIYDKSKNNGTVFSSEYDEATARGITEIVKLLIEDKDIDIVNGRGESLLIIAVKRENACLVDYLLSSGIDINIADSSKKTAYDYAKEIGNESIVALFWETDDGTVS